MACAAQLKRSFAGEIDKVEMREDSAKQRTVDLARGKRARSQPPGLRKAEVEHALLWHRGPGLVHRLPLHHEERQGGSPLTRC